MFAVVLADLRAWSKDKSRPTFLVIVGTQAIVGLVAMLEPGYYFMALAVLTIWFACLTGEYGWAGIPAVDWVVRGGLSPVKVVAGRILTALVLAMIIHFAALPGTVMLAILSGMPPLAMARVVLASALGAVSAAAWGASGATADYQEDSYFGRLIAGLWLAITMGLPVLRPGNPFWQTWQASTRLAPRLFPRGVGLGLLMAAFGFLLAVGILHWRVRK